jgi:hypothetical protein
MSVYLDARNEGPPPEKRRNSDTVSTDEEWKAMISFPSRKRFANSISSIWAEYTAYDVWQRLEERIGAQRESEIMLRQQQMK